MSPFAPQVVAAAALLSSPVLYQALVARTAAVDFALTRFLVIWVVTWVVVSVVVDLLFPSRLETERRIRDIELAEREVRKAREEAEAAEAEAAAAAADGADAAGRTGTGGSSGPSIPQPRSASKDSTTSGQHRAS